MRLDRLTGADLAALFGRVRTKSGRQGTGLAEASVARVHATLSRAFADAVEAGLLAANPARQVPRLSRPRQARPGGDALRYWTGPQLRDFLSVAADDRLAPLLRLAAHTGMRRGEVAGLRWVDVELEAGHVSVRQTRTGGGRHGVLVGAPESGKGRRVDLDPGTVAALCSWRFMQAQDRLALGGAWPDHD